MDDHINLSRDGVEPSGANDGAGVGSVDCHMWLGTEEAPAVHSYRVEDCGFVGAEDLGIPVAHA